MRIVVQANAPHGQAEKEIARSGARSLVYSTKLRATFKATKKPRKAGKVFVVEDAKRTGEIVRLSLAARMAEFSIRATLQRASIRSTRSSNPQRSRLVILWSERRFLPGSYAARTRRDLS